MRIAKIVLTSITLTMLLFGAATRVAYADDGHGGKDGGKRTPTPTPAVMQQQTQNVQNNSGSGDQQKPNENVLGEQASLPSGSKAASNTGTKSKSKAKSGDADAAAASGASASKEVVLPAQAAPEAVAAVNSKPASGTASVDNANVPSMSNSASIDQ